MRRALRGVRSVVAMVNSRSTSLEIAKKTDSSEAELENLIKQATQQKNPSAVFRLDVDGESSDSSFSHHACRSK